MSELEALVVRGHHKIIDHYRRLRDCAVSGAERERFQRCIDEEQDALRKFTERRSYLTQRAA